MPTFTCTFNFFSGKAVIQLSLAFSVTVVAIDLNGESHRNIDKKICLIDGCMSTKTILARKTILKVI